MSKKYVMPCEVYSRVAGYYRPVQNWNVGKQQEFRERNTYDKKIQVGINDQRRKAEKI